MEGLTGLLLSQQFVIMALAVLGGCGVMILLQYRRDMRSSQASALRIQRASTPAKATRSKSRQHTKKVDAHRAVLIRREWEEVIGIPRRKYRMRIIVGALMAAVMAYILTGSFAMGIAGAIGLMMAGRFWTQRRISAFQERIGSEILPTADSIIKDLEHHSTLFQALSRIAKEGIGRGGSIDARHRADAASTSPVAQLFRRVVSSQATLEHALAIELENTNNELLIEFLHVLLFVSRTDLGASPQAIAQQLKSFRNVYSKEAQLRANALAKASSARGTRGIVMAVIPFTVGMNLLIGGSEAADLMLRSVVGNILLIVVGGLAAAAWVLTERVSRL